MSVKTQPIGEHEQRNDRPRAGNQNHRSEIATSPEAHQCRKGQKSGNGEISTRRYANAGQFLSLRRSNMATHCFDQYFA